MRRHVTRLDWSKARFLITCPWMSDAGLGTFEADGTWHVKHGTPGAGLVPFRCYGGPAATLEEVLFIADCVSFDHDMPTVVRPHAATRAAKQLAPLEALVPSPERLENILSYANAIESALGSLGEVRLGDASLRLRYIEYPRLTDFRNRFAGVEEPLGLYAMATRQVEILGEYLCLYRVLEWADGKNGMTYVERHLGAIATRDFGYLMADAWPHRRKRRANIFRIYRRRAVKRLTTLRTRFRDDRRIASQLYGIRNGLAHGRPGRSNIVLDRTTSVSEVALDLPIVKLLARMVIDKA